VTKQGQLPFKFYDDDDDDDGRFLACEDCGKVKVLVRNT
jgi:hypothetical protein